MNQIRLRTLTKRLNDYEELLSIKESDLQQAERNMQIELNKPILQAFMFHSKEEYLQDIKDAKYAVKWIEKRIKQVITDLNKIK